MYPKTIVEQQQAYQVRVQEALSGEITALEFKAYSGGMGVYPQRGLKTFMVRPRIDAGALSAQDLAVLCQLSDGYSHGWLHLTTRQDVQLHNCCRLLYLLMRSLK